MDRLNEFFLDMTPEQEDLLVESPMDRYECCEHCRAVNCPRHDGHPDPCERKGCAEGNTMVGEYRA
jgi:hypothetical protein